jgi:hypothetical protein
MTESEFTDQPVPRPVDGDPGTAGHAPAVGADEMATTRVRPKAAGALSVLLILFGVLGLIVTFAEIVTVRSNSATLGVDVPGFIYGLLYGQLVLAAGQFVSGIAIRRGGRAWARVLPATVCWLNIVAALFLLFTGSIAQAVFAFVINGLLLWLLSRYEVIEWCR